MKNQIQRGFPTPQFRDEFFSPLDTLFDKVFSDAFPELSKEVGVDVFQKSAYPKCDIINFDDRIEIVAEIPGLTKEQITIDIDGDVISLKGEKILKYSIWMVLKPYLMMVFWNLRYQEKKNKFLPKGQFQ